MPTGKEWRKALGAEARHHLAEIDRHHDRLRKFTRGRVSCKSAKQAYKNMQKIRYALRSFEFLARRVDAREAVDEMERIQEMAKSHLDSAYERLKEAGCTPV